MPRSRDIFDKTKNYNKIFFNELTALMDAELNEAEDILKEKAGLSQLTGIGDVVIGDGFQVEATGNANEFLVRRGVIFVDGVEIRNHSDITVTGLTTPIGLRVDNVYIYWTYLKEIDGVADPNIIDPTLGVQTTTRQQTYFEIKVAEGVAIPLPAANYNVFRIATLNRTGDIITSGEIVDDRIKAANSFVRFGLMVKQGTNPFDFDIDAGEVYVGDTRYSVSSATRTIPANMTHFVYVDHTGTIINNNIGFPTTFHAKLAVVNSNAVGITSIVDQRKFEAVVARDRIILEWLKLARHEHVLNITPSGAVDGVNTTFTVPDAYVAGSLAVYKQGLRMNEGATNDYVETDPATGTFDFNVAPIAGSIIVVDYIKVNPVP